jgi:hypothetical protein
MQIARRRSSLNVYRKLPRQALEELVAWRRPCAVLGSLAAAKEALGWQAG